MRHIFRLEPISLAIALLLALPLPAQSVPTKPAVAQAAVTSPLTDVEAYAARQFGPTFKLDPTIKPMFGDLDGDGREDLVLVATSSSPLLSQEEYRFKVADPYDAYFGTGDTRITSTFTLHFDGSSRCILIVFNWRESSGKPDPKKISKFVLINTPFESVSIVNLQLKKKTLQAVETIDRSSLHALIFWNGKRWRWSAQGMEGDDSFKMPPPDDPVKMPPMK
jgi:hypothetical protein